MSVTCREFNAPFRKLFYFRKAGEDFERIVKEKSEGIEMEPQAETLFKGSVCYESIFTHLKSVEQTKYSI